ncbi:MAG: 2-dehydropantoate 2-reductase [Candidatus Gracilibacteria bacterium]
MRENFSENRILVVGGAIGTFLGAKLHAAGCSVDLLGRGKIAHLGDTIRIQEKGYAMPPRLTALPEDSNYDLVVLATKLHHLHDILAQIQQARVRAGSLVSIQNGLVDNTQFNDLLGEQRLMVASVFDGFRIDGERLLTTNTGKGWKVEESSEGQKVAQIFKDAQILCSTEPDLDRYRAEKSIVNCCLNGLSAIHDKTFIELFADPALNARIERLFEECYAILATTFPLEARESLKARIFEGWRYADHYSSTWQDLTERKPTEIDFLNGFMVQLGRTQGSSIAENESVIRELREKENSHS